MLWLWGYHKFISYYLTVFEFFHRVLLHGCLWTITTTSVQFNIIQTHHISCILLFLMLAIQGLVNIIQLVLERLLDMLAQIDVVVDQMARLLGHRRYFSWEAASRWRHCWIRVCEYFQLLGGHSLCWTRRLVVSCNLRIEEMVNNVNNMWCDVKVLGKEDFKSLLSTFTHKYTYCRWL